MIYGSQIKLTEDKARQLDINTEIDQLKTIYMGGGSSFKKTDKSSFINRYENYLDNEYMQKIFNDQVVTQYWKQLLEQENVN